MEHIQQNSFYFIYAVAAVSLIITFIGVIASLKLPIEQRVRRIGKFALVGAALFLFVVPVFKPMIWYYTPVKYLDKIEVAEQPTTEDFIKIEKQQVQQIERLKEEVVELRREVRDANMYYSTIFQLLSHLAAMLCMFFAFRKDEKTVENITE